VLEFSKTVRAASCPPEAPAQHVAEQSRACHVSLALLCVSLCVCTDLNPHEEVGERVTHPEEGVAERRLRQRSHWEAVHNDSRKRVSKDKVRISAFRLHATEAHHPRAHLVSEWSHGLRSSDGGFRVCCQSKLPIA
jgi:hypothetical protein